MEAAGGGASRDDGHTDERGTVVGRLAAARAFLSPPFEPIFRGPQQHGMPSVRHLSAALRQFTHNGSLSWGTFVLVLTNLWCRGCWWPAQGCLALLCQHMRTGLVALGSPIFGMPTSRSAMEVHTPTLFACGQVDKGRMHCKEQVSSGRLHYGDGGAKLGLVAALSTPLRHLSLRGPQAGTHCV